jgi:phosphatidylethanolamine/phosphatidyl-N-methylethanolamine N-methyltransferase
MTQIPLEAAQRLKATEKEWQDQTGNALIERSYGWAGSRLVYEDQFRRIADRLQPEPGMTVAEIGCGRGQLLDYLFRRFKAYKPRLVGVDISARLAEVKARFDPALTWIMADGEHLPFADHRLDAIVYNGALHHMPDFKAALTETFRCVRPGGQVVVFEPVSTPFSRAMHHLLDPLVFQQKVKYESPVDEFCKDSFRLSALAAVIRGAGCEFHLSRHDSLAYPLTGCYAGSFFSHRPRMMRLLLRLEQALHPVPVIKPVLDFFSWRILLDIRTPCRPRTP